MGRHLAQTTRKDAVRGANAGAASRAAAARRVHAVRSLHRSLADTPQAGDLDDERDRALVQELSYGTLRQLPRLESIARMLANKPLKAEDRDLDALILVGLYQLTATRIPPHAAVAATVEAARTLRKAWAAPLVNAQLRRFLRERTELLARAERSPEGQWLLPFWLLEHLQTAWPDAWQAIAAATNARAPMTLRVNLLRTSAADYADRLAAAGLTGRPARWTQSGITLDHPVPAERLPGFAEGLVSVQDAAAQLAAGLLDAPAGARVLDACAAPGGKSAHILEHAGGRLDLTALDADPQRLARVDENLHRLGLTARTVQGDAAQPSGDWAEKPYSHILLDVPCSATGVIRRHPDIKWLRRPADIATLATLQARMLDAVWPLLAPGGVLLYATCSLLPEENERQIGAFLERRRDARATPFDARWGVARDVGCQTLPEEGGMDGFYYARLEKAA
jgi:16S rRNA (cytosine967-C5)-methyltransferase